MALAASVPTAERLKDWALGTIRATDGVRLPGHVVVGRDLAQGPEGELWWLVAPPARRHWADDAGLISERRVDWRLVQDGDDAVLRVAGTGAEADVFQLRGDVAAAFRCATSPEALTVIGPYRPLGGPRDLAAHISARGPLMTPFGEGTRLVSETVALSLYRIARWRGGAFWDAAARWIAEWGVQRARALEAQTEMRFVGELALLLLAAGEDEAADRALDVIEAHGTPLADGTWYHHDRGEVAAGRNDLVLNTHLQALVVLAAGGRPVAAGQRALEHALAMRHSWREGLGLAARISGADLCAAAGVGRAGVTAWELHVRWANLRGRDPHLVLVPGLLGRDATVEATPRYYRTVNLLDLAAVSRVAPTPAAVSELRRGLWLARATGFLRAQRKAREPIAVFEPTLLRATGHGAAAQRAADRARAVGLAPAIGWPGYVDAPWRRLPPGIV